MSHTPIFARYKIISNETIESIRTFSKEEMERYLIDPNTTDPQDHHINIDASWKGLILILKAVEKNSAAEALFGQRGDQIGPDLGYGPATLLPFNTIAAIVADLSQVTCDRIRENANTDVFPEIWEDTAAMKDYFALQYNKLTSLLTSASKEGKNIIYAIMQ